MGVIKSKHRVTSTYSCQNGEANHEEDAAKAKCAVRDIPILCMQIKWAKETYQIFHSRWWDILLRRWREK